MSAASPPGSTRLGKVVIVNTADRGGGAERAAMLTLEGFEALGTETWLAVGAKHTDHRGVVPFHLSPHVDYSSHAAFRRRSALQVRRLIGSRLGLEDFDHPYSRYLLQLTGSTPDLVLCHNLHGGFFDLRSLPQLTHRIPVVLRLSDSWLFSGHCACPRGCARWETGCGSCPDLSIPPAVERDSTALNWTRKQRIFAASRVFVAAPSRWLMDRAQRSLLGPAIEGGAIVPNGIELDVFTPGSRSAARRRLGIRPDRRVLLFVATSGRDNPYKDFATIRSAVARLSEERTGAPLELIVVGNQGPDELLDGGGRVRHLPYCDSRSRLAEVYRAADLYVHAAPEESFGLTVAEALACGTPVVAAASGGISEVVDDGRTGLLVAPGRPEELAAALRGLLDDPARRERMGAAAARSARPRLGCDRMVTELHAWCEEVAERWHGPAAESSARVQPSPLRPSVAPTTRPAHDRPPMELAVVAPLEDFRGDVIEHLRSWTACQTLPRERYQVVIGANGEHPEFERRVAGLLAPHDLLVRVPGASLMGLWDAAARAARAPWLLFTEAHCVGDPDCLAVLARALADERGFAAANLEHRQAAHTRVGALTERWFERVHAEWERAEWTRVNMAGVAIHRDAYARAGGLDSRYGLFSSPLLSARLHESGERVARVPGAVISHRLEESMRDGLALSADWARGECVVRAEHDRTFCRHYFGAEGMLDRYDAYRPEIARTLLSGLVPTAASGWRDARWLARETAARVPAAIAGARARLTAERLACACHSRVADARLPTAVRWRSYVSAHESAVRREQLRWIMDVGGPSTSPLPAGCAVSAAELGGALVGTHALEYHGERPFRWTEPVALLRVELPDRDCVLRLDTGGLRGSPLEHVRSLRVGARSLPRALMRADGGALEVSLPRVWARRATRRGVTVLCRPLVPRRHGSADPRRLGLPIFSLETRAA